MENNFEYFLNQMESFGKRLSSLENSNQVNVINIGDNIEIDGVNGRLLMRDATTNRVLIDGVNGWMKISRPGYDVLTATYSQLIMSSQISTPRESNISFGNWSYTNATSYEILYNNACKIDFNDWPDSVCYLEVTGKTGGGTASYSLRNVTDGSDVAGSECTTTSTTATVFRSGAFTKPSGSKQLALQYKVSNATYYTDIYSCRVVMRSA